MQDHTHPKENSSRHRVDMCFCSMLSMLHEVKECPLSPAYMAMMSHGVSLTEFTMAIKLLELLELLKVTDEMATYIEPKPGSRGEMALRTVLGMMEGKSAKAESN